MVLVATRLFSLSEQFAAAEEMKTVDYSGYDSLYRFHQG